MDSPPETREAAPRQGKAAPLTKLHGQDATPAAIGKPQSAAVLGILDQLDKANTNRRFTH